MKMKTQNKQVEKQHMDYVRELPAKLLPNFNGLTINEAKEVTERLIRFISAIPIKTD